MLYKLTLKHPLENAKGGKSHLVEVGVVVGGQGVDSDTENVKKKEEERNLVAQEKRIHSQRQAKW